MARITENAEMERALHLVRLLDPYGHSADAISCSVPALVKGGDFERLRREMQQTLIPAAQALLDGASAEAREERMAANRAANCVLQGMFTLLGEPGSKTREWPKRWGVYTPFLISALRYPQCQSEESDFTLSLAVSVALMIHNLGGLDAAMRHQFRVAFEVALPGTPPGLEVLIPAAMIPLLRAEFAYQS